MKVLIVVFLLICPMLVAFTSSFWFWRIKYIACLRKKARKLDDEVINVTAQKMTIAELRRIDGNRLGDEVVVVHHLVSLAEDAQDSIFKEGVCLTLGNVVFLLFVALFIGANTPRAEPVHVAASQSVVAGSEHAPLEAERTSVEHRSLAWDAIDQLKLVVNEAIIMYGVPVSMLAFFLHNLLFTLSLREQTRKYRSVLPGVEC